MVFLFRLTLCIALASSLTRHVLAVVKDAGSSVNGPFHSDVSFWDLACVGDLPQTGWPEGHTRSDFRDLVHLCDIMYVGCVCFETGNLWCDPSYSTASLHNAFVQHCRAQCTCFDAFNPKATPPPAIPQTVRAASANQEVESPYRPKSTLSQIDLAGMEAVMAKYDDQCRSTACSSWDGCPPPTGPCQYSCKTKPAPHNAPWLWRGECVVSYGFKKAKKSRRQLNAPPPKMPYLRDISTATNPNTTTPNSSSTTFAYRPANATSQINNTALVAPCPCNCTYVSHGCCDLDRGGLVYEAADQKLGSVVPPLKSVCCDERTGKMAFGKWENRNGTCSTS
ncbi:MAG: hypothetical protein M1817_000117 [Caeruleum heppii]|nr:MAG: hypothetical protein M1817_000117 [Caeruleum heppii]